MLKFRICIRCFRAYLCGFCRLCVFLQISGVRSFCLCQRRSRRLYRHYGRRDDMVWLGHQDLLSKYDRWREVKSCTSLQGSCRSLLCPGVFLSWMCNTFGLVVWYGSLLYHEWIEVSLGIKGVFIFSFFQECCDLVCEWQEHYFYKYLEDVIAYPDR